ncbi:hypothetical protein ACFE04_000385 [Oxalis oulophora]
MGAREQHNNNNNNDCHVIINNNRSEGLGFGEGVRVWVSVRESGMEGVGEGGSRRWRESVMERIGEGESRRWRAKEMEMELLVVEVPNVNWEDIGGLENVKRELQECNHHHIICRGEASFLVPQCERSVDHLDLREGSETGKNVVGVEWSGVEEWTVD